MTDPAALERVLAAIDPQLRLVTSQPLTGGVSSEVTAIDAVRPGGLTERLVVRQYGPANLASDPHSAVHEYRLLAVLRSAGLPVPRPRYVDESRQILPSPYLVTEFIEGAIIAEPDLLTLPLAGFASQLAAALAGLHTASLTLTDVPHLNDIRDRVTRKLESRPGCLDAALDEAVIRAALGRIWPPPQLNQPVVVHGDYWPGNVLWRHDRLVAVLDWEDAAVGDPLADLGNGRMELCMLFGWPAAAAFTAAYQTVLPGLDFRTLAHWDLYAALRHTGRMDEWGLSDAARARLEAGHREFSAIALDQHAGPGRTSPHS
jgi:aminoglycoside phosphotransferase (APT) family kinase protein